MRRIPTAGVLAVGAALALGAAARAQPIEAEITYYHRAKKAQETVKAVVVEETPGVIAYRSSGRVEQVPAADVLEVVYQPASALVRQEVRRALRHEDEIDKATDSAARKKAVQQAMDSYRALLPQMGDSRFAVRHIAFKRAQLALRLAEYDPSQRDAAEAVLTKFLQEHGAGWQVGLASKWLAQLHLEKGDPARAQKVFDDLVNKPDLTRETRQEYQLLAVRALMRSRKYAEARAQLRRMQERLLPEDASTLTRVAIYLAGCDGAEGQLAAAEKQLKAVLEGDAETRLKALACNVLADRYLEAGKEDEAFWRFLMVDTLYNQDSEELARALYHLAQLFEKLRKDPARAQECRERLLQEKQFAGAEYRRLASKVK
jgi:hypothetical protein